MKYAIRSLNEKNLYVTNIRIEYDKNVKNNIPDMKISVSNNKDDAIVFDNIDLITTIICLINTHFDETYTIDIIR